MKEKFTIENILIIVSILLIIIGLCNPFFVKYVLVEKISLSELGTIGDWFGGLSGPLIGMSSFILVYLAFRLQNKQMKNQQIEFEKQNTILSLQRFETSFFQLLSFHNDIVSALWVCYKFPIKKQISRPIAGGNNGETEKIEQITEGTETSDKREYFSTVYLMLQHNLLEINKTSKSLSVEMKNSTTYLESVVIENYKVIYNKEQASLGHYFRHLYQIVKYIHNSELISEKEKKQYAAILRSQLSAYELVLLFYNCFVDDLGYPKFKYLVDKYDLIQNMNRELLLDSNDFKIFNSKICNEDCLKE